MQKDTPFERAMAKVRRAAEDGDVDYAVRQAAQAKEVAPDDAAAWKELGNLLVELGAAKEGIDALERATLYADDDLGLHSSLAYAYANAGEPEHAAQIFKDIVQMEGGYPYLDDLATMEILCGNYGRAEKALEQARRSTDKPGSPTVATVEYLSSVRELVRVQDHEWREVHEDGEVFLVPCERDHIDVVQEAIDNVDTVPKDDVAPNVLQNFDSEVQSAERVLDEASERQFAGIWQVPVFSLILGAVLILSAVDGHNGTGAIGLGVVYLLNAPAYIFAARPTTYQLHKRRLDNPGEFMGDQEEVSGFVAFFRILRWSFFGPFVTGWEYLRNHLNG